MAKLLQFSKGHPKPAFSEKFKVGTKGNISKIAQKVALAWKAQQYSVESGIIR